MNRPSTSLLLALALAALGIYLAVDAWLAGSLLRYVLAGITAGSLLCVPLLSLLLFRDRARRVWRRLLFAMVPLIALLLLAEVAMRVLGPTRERPAVLRADPRLGHVLEPGTAGSDAQGWRNADVPKTYDVFVAGDSQTWGFGVDREHAFSARLGAHLHRHVYQMGNGSYGPVQYLEMVRRALEKQAQQIAIAFYFGNDLVDAVDYAALDGAEPVRSPDFAYELRHNPELDGLSTPNATMAAVDHILAASVLLDTTAHVIKAQLRGGVLDRQPNSVPFEHDSAPTVLLPSYRLPPLNPRNRGVQEGMRVTARCLQQIAHACREAGAKCHVLLIPTKEYTYAEWQGDALPQLEAVHAAEREMRHQMQQALTAADLPAIDVAPELIAAMARGEAPWFPTGDGHLGPHGHALVAAVLAQALRE